MIARISGRRLPLALMLACCAPSVEAATPDIRTLTVKTEAIHMTGLAPDNPFNIPLVDPIRTAGIEMAGLSRDNPYNIPAVEPVLTLAIEMTGLSPENPYNIPRVEPVRTAAIEMTGYQLTPEATAASTSFRRDPLAGAWTDDDGNTVCVSVSSGVFTARYPNPQRCRYGGEVAIFIRGDLAEDGSISGRIFKCEVNSPPRLVADCNLASVRERNFRTTKVTGNEISGTWDGEFIAYDRTADGGYQCTAFRPRPNAKNFVMRRASPAAAETCNED